MDLDAFLLARIQFAANITFHILFPTITISLAWVLLFFKLRFVKTGQQHWMDAYQFWVKIFALTFALGVVSGITMSFQFGTNWPGFMEKTGNISGPLLGYEVLTAFFLEATFLGIMLFGWQRVPPNLHVTSAVLVALDGDDAFGAERQQREHRVHRDPFHAGVLQWGNCSARHASRPAQHSSAANHYTDQLTAVGTVSAPGRSSSPSTRKYS